MDEAGAKVFFVFFGATGRAAGTGAAGRGCVNVKTLDVVEALSCLLLNQPRK